MNRRQMLLKVRDRTDPWDVVIIGGGATGMGCALDAATRGLAVLLLEQADFGKGTSGRSTKLIHGGVRYLAQGRIGLVREALSERTLLYDLAPDFVKVREFLVPVYSHFRKWYYSAGLKIYDRLAGNNPFSGVRVIRAGEAAAAMPGLVTKGLKGAVRYRDGSFDDTRFLIALAKTAVDAGAVIANYVQVVSVAPIEDQTGSVIRFREGGSDDIDETRARSVISARGIFTSDISGSRAAERPPEVTFSQGIHIVLDSEFLDADKALLVPGTPDGRVLFAVPWHGRTLVGTTDTPVSSPELEPVALEEEVEYLLGTCGSFFRKRPRRADVLSMFAGIRPLVASATGKPTSRLSREHRIDISEGGLVTVTGGKWTTYRRMAEEAVDAAVKAGGIDCGESVTAETPIPDRHSEIARRIASESPRLAAQMSPAFDYTWADIVAGIRNEMAVNLDDVLSRRTRILYVDAREAIRLAPDVADLLAKELKWTPEQRNRELERFNDIASHFIPREP